MNPVSDTAAAGGEEPGSSEPAGADPASDPPEPGETADRPSPAACGAVVEVTVAPDVGGGPTPDAAWLREKLRSAVPLIEAPLARVSVSVVDDAAMEGLHRRFAGRGGPTDVLAFPATDGGPRIEGDVAVNAEEARRQASARGHTVERELLLYALHGALHCAGFDDRDPDGARAMHAEEDRILGAIGVGATFDRPASRSAEAKS